MASDYPNIETWARNRLRKADADLSDADLDLDIAAVIRVLNARFPCLGEGEYPWDLAEPDLGFFNEAAGLLTAARLYAGLPQTEATGPLKRWKQKDVEQEFATSATASSDPLPVQWAKEARTALSYIACIRAVNRAAASAFSAIRVAGPTRAAREAGCRQGLVDDMLRLIYPDWCHDTEDD